MRYLLIFFYFIVLSTGLSFASNDPVVIGLNADMSSGSAQSGIAIERGLLIAIEEINRNGGILGHKVKLLVADHRGNPSRGKWNMKKMVANPDIIAVFGGLHTPVMLAEKKALFDTGKAEIPYLAPWAAGSSIVENRWIFRLSVRDEYAGPFLINRAFKSNYRKIALLLENTPWGRGNEKSMKQSLKAKGLTPVSIEWFSWKVDPVRVARKLEIIHQKGADVILMVANAPEGATIIQAMAARKEEQRIPILSHWGITGGDFPKRAGMEALRKINLSFLQTYSFISNKKRERNRAVVALAKQLFPDSVKEAEDLFSPAGTAHAYDLMHILARAIRLANSTNRSKIRNALEQLKEYRGLVKRYAPPFQKGTGRNHDALNISDFQLSRFFFDKEKLRWIIIPEKTGDKP